ARAFEMRILASDPFVTPRIAADLGVDLAPLADLYQQSDYITLHVSLTPDTDKMLNAEALARMKNGVRIVNCARGELVDEAALKAAIESGKVAGACLDVFAKEPTDASYPLFALDTVLATPHIGGSTEEAQEIVGVRIAEQMVEYLQNGVAINAVNMPALSPEQYRAAAPFIELAQRLGVFASHLAGVLGRSTASKANVINAMPIAAERGWNVAEVHDKRGGHMDSIRLEVETDSSVTAVEGAVVLGKPR